MQHLLNGLPDQGWLGKLTTVNPGSMATLPR
jgi:hypothetical protein